MKYRLEALSLLMVFLFLMTGAMRSEAQVNCPNGISVTVSGAGCIEVGESSTYKCTASPFGGDYEWSCSGGLAIISGHYSSSAVVVALETPSSNEGDQSVTCTYTVSEQECADEVEVTVVKMEGDILVSEGGSGSYRIIPADVEVSEWSVIPVDSPEEILKDSDVEVTDTGVDVTFYWFPKDGDQYVKATCGGTTLSKKVYVTLPLKGATTSFNSSPDYKAEPDPVNPINWIFHSSGWTTSAPETTYKVPDNSPFVEGEDKDGNGKIPQHEAQHISDFTGGEESPAAVYGAAHLAGLCSDRYDTSIEFLEYSRLKTEEWTPPTKAAIIEWAEGNAYDISNEIWPTCAYQTGELD